MLPTSSAYLESGNNSLAHLNSQPNSVSGYVRIKSRENSIFGGAGGGIVSLDNTAAENSLLEFSSPLNDSTLNPTSAMSSGIIGTRASLQAKQS